MNNPQPLPTPLALVTLIRGADTSEQGEHLLKMWLEQWRSPAKTDYPDGHAAFGGWDSIPEPIQYLSPRIAATRHGVSNTTRRLPKRG